MKPANKSIAIIAGARPNFMKVAPLCRELEKQKMRYVLINTGQHFSSAMASSFLKEFQLKPDYTLSPSRQTVARQMADIQNGLKKIFNKVKPGLVIVVGDVNSTLAGAQVAKEMNIPLAHIEAGLRSFNPAMPEEYNRIQTDRLADLLFVTQEEGVKNLRKEGVTKGVHFVGNIMIDTLKLFVKKTNQPKAACPPEWRGRPLAEKIAGCYYFCTLHRAENVDNKKVFSEIVAALEAMSQDAIIYLPLHPRTKKMAEKFGLLSKLRSACKILPPLTYAQSVAYQQNARLILTDSGGVQEEASFLGVPCLTLRTETERPITVAQGTNVIAGVTKQSIFKAYRVIDFKKKKVSIEFWDGKTAQRIVDKIRNFINNKDNVKKI